LRTEINEKGEGVIKLKANRGNKKLSIKELKENSSNKNNKKC
jgi:hypothetical protein